MIVQCTGKHSFNTWAKAEHAAKMLRRYTDDAVHPYRCRKCQRFHVGG